MGGVVHSFVLGETLLDTLRLNLVSEEDLKGTEFTSGLGTPAWERMPLERDTAAEELKTSYIGRLVPMLRFVLMEGEQLHITYGVQPESTIAEPTASVWTNAKGDRRMARMLSGAHWSAIASAYGYGLKEGETAVCRQLAWCLPRARTDKAFAGCWIAGVRTSYNSGEQYFGSGDEMFAWRFAADGSEDALREKFAFMRKLSSAVYASLSQLRQVIEAPKLDSRIAIQSTPAKTFVSSRHEGIMRDLMDDFGELLAVTGTEPTRPLVKQYLQDSVFATILPFPSSWEGEIRAACASPRDVLSIGRKACVPTIPVLQGVADTFEDAVSILSQVEEKRNSVSDAPVQRQRVYEETKDFRKARWRLQDVPLAFRPAYEYGWRYVTVRPAVAL